MSVLWFHDTAPVVTDAMKQHAKLAQFPETANDFGQ